MSSEEIIGTGRLLKRVSEHPYIGKEFLDRKDIETRILERVNRGRSYRGEAVETQYYITSKVKDKEFGGIERAVEMILVHGTTEAWQEKEEKPPGYDTHMSWLKEVKLLGVNYKESLEAAIVTIATPLEFFDKGEDLPLIQLRMATSSEPFNAFSDYTARLIDYRFPEGFKKKFLGQVWPHRRIREYLNIEKEEPIIGTIVKPKWLPPELFARSVVESALAGALFIKSDENLHLTIKELETYVKLTVKNLEENGFDLSFSPNPVKKRIIFAPHITVSPFKILEYAKVAIDSGANALMFSPHFSGDFLSIQEIYKMGEEYKVPIYAHTAGMNRYTGDPNYSFGEDPKTVYLLAALSGVAFMQLPALRGYIRPADEEKFSIIERLREEGLEGENGMTLVIAGGLSAKNIGYNIKVFGAAGRMFLAGTSIYHHPDGIKAGIDALKLAVKLAHKGIVEIPEMKEYAKGIPEGIPLLRALE
jgi:ribulose 1,5-bisphosphate carboxylase large subunit-like protein